MRRRRKTSGVTRATPRWWRRLAEVSFLGRTNNSRRRHQAVGLKGARRPSEEIQIPRHGLHAALSRGRSTSRLRRTVVVALVFGGAVVACGLVAASPRATAATARHPARVANPVLKPAASHPRSASSESAVAATGSALAAPYAGPRQVNASSAASDQSARSVTAASTASSLRYRFAFENRADQ